MNLGQMMMVIGAIVMLGVLILNTNSTIYQTNDIMYTSEFGVTAISLSTSLAEEAMGKMFDKVVADSNAAALIDSTLLTLPGSLGPDASENESYRGYPVGSGKKDFDDFDDFNGLNLCFHSEVPADIDATPGYLQVIVPGIRAKYYVSCTVTYVNPPNLDAPYAVRQTWHKKMTVTVTSPSATGVTGKPDTLAYPAIMSYWN
ncbi:MAG TPA: hypothetical protein VF514_05845 [Bacteroidota bacterium]